MEIKKRSLVAIAMSFLTIILGGCMEGASGKHSPEELKYDLDFMVKTMEDVHPDLYRYTPKEEIYKMKSDIERSLDKPMTRIEFYRMVGPLVARIGDGHTQIRPPMEEFNDYLSEGGLVFPFDTRVIGNRLFVEADYNRREIPQGSEILEINGHPSSDLISELIKYVSGERIPFRIAQVNKNLRELLWLIYGWEEFDIRYLSPSGETLQKKVKGIAQEDIERACMGTQERTENFSFRALPDLKTGIIDIRYFLGTEFDSFLEETFKEIKEEEVKYLIIDIRGNGGGNSNLVDALLNYITDNPYNHVSKIDFKVSQQIKEFYKDPEEVLKEAFPESYEPMSQTVKEYYEAVYRSISSIPPGKVIRGEDILTFFYEGTRKPSENPLRFHGEVYVLIDSGTFSAATGFADIIKNYGIGTLVGEETGDLPASFSNAYYFKLPNTDLLAQVSHMKVYGTGGVDTGEGVLPDIKVTTTVEDIIEGRDPVMDRVLEIIRNKIGE